MEFNYKNYRFYKLKDIFKTKSIALIFNWINPKKKKSFEPFPFICTKNTRQTGRVRDYKISNALMNCLLKHSIFNDVISLFSGPILFMTYCNNTDFCNLVSFFKHQHTFLCLKINKKIYTIIQLIKVKCINYFIFINSLYEKLHLAEEFLLNINYYYSKQCDLNT